MANVSRKGYGQVEPNHLSAQKTGQIYAQLPANSSINILENGQFVKYNYAQGRVDTQASAGSDSFDGEWMMVFNEVHTYDERDRYYKDFAMMKDDYNHGIITPRVIKTNIGDIFTTNTLKTAATPGGKDATYVLGDEDDLVVGAMLQPNSAGYLEYTASAASGKPTFQIVKVYTLADNQWAVKVQRVA